MDREEHEKKKKAPKVQRAGKGAGRKRRADAYKMENREARNRERRMWRTLRAQPNNAQLARQLGLDPEQFRIERLRKRRGK